jgi:hypothetical protein
MLQGRAPKFWIGLLLRIICRPVPDDWVNFQPISKQGGELERFDIFAGRTSQVYEGQKSKTVAHAKRTLTS